MVRSAGTAPEGGPLPWIERELERLLQSATGHATLLYGLPGVGQFELAMAVAQAWLCEQVQPAAGRYAPSCGVCPSCRLCHARTHPDLLPLLPDSMAESLGWNGGEDADSADQSASTKASKEIKIAAVRRALAFAQITSSRGRAKILVVHPAERLNEVAANALLKTLEEPPGHARFILGSVAVDALLPTIRSRCQAFHVPLPDTAMVSPWLAQQGVDDPQVLLAATGGQPGEALLWFKDGITARAWAALPEQIIQGQVGDLAAWPLVRVMESMQKLCHDAMRLSVKAPPRYFAAETWPAGIAFDANELVAWSRRLQAQRRHADHPWNQALAVQSLVDDAARVLTCGKRITLQPPALRRLPPERPGIR